MSFAGQDCERPLQVAGRWLRRPAPGQRSRWPERSKGETCASALLRKTKLSVGAGASRRFPILAAPGPPPRHPASCELPWLPQPSDALREQLLVSWGGTGVSDNKRQATLNHNPQLACIHLCISYPTTHSHTTASIHTCVRLCACVLPLSSTPLTGLSSMKWCLCLRCMCASAWKPSMHGMTLHSSLVDHK